MAASQLQRKLCFAGHNGCNKIKHTSFLKTNCSTCFDTNARDDQGQGLGLGIFFLSNFKLQRYEVEQEQENMGNNALLLFLFIKFFLSLLCPYHFFQEDVVFDAHIVMLIHWFLTGLMLSFTFLVNNLNSVILSVFCF